MSVVSGLGKGAALPPRSKMIDYAVKALSDLQEEQYLMGSRLVLTALHNLFSEPENERFHRIRTTNAVSPLLSPGAKPAPTIEDSSPNATLVIPPL